MVPSGTGPGAGLPKERKIRSRVKVIVWCYSRFCVQNVVRNVVIHILSFIFKEYARFQILYCIIVPFGLTLSDWSLAYLKRYSNDAGCFKSLASSYLWRNTFHLTYCCFYCSKRSMAKLKWSTEETYGRDFWTRASSQKTTSGKGLLSKRSSVNDRFVRLLNSIVYLCQGVVHFLLYFMKKEKTCIQMWFLTYYIFCLMP